VILLDAYALIAFVGGEPVGADVGGLLRERSAGITTVNLAEAIDVLGRVHGAPIDRTRSIVDSLVGGPLTVIAFESRHAWRTASLRCAHYHRTKRSLSLADCALLAVAAEGHAIATADRDVVAVARAEGIEAIALPDSRGRRLR